jgi:hypothetical protein
VGCEKRRQLASAIIDEFCACVIPLEQQLERGIIHGDFNEQVVTNRWKGLFVGPEPTSPPPPEITKITFSTPVHHASFYSALFLPYFDPFDIIYRVCSNFVQ